MSKKKTDGRMKKRINFSVCLLALLLLLLAAACMSAQGMEENSTPPPEEDSAPAETSPQAQDGSLIGPPDTGSAPEAPAGADRPLPEDGAYDYGAPVPEAAAVENDWFSDAVFIGDSRTEGLMLFSGLTEGRFYVKQGLMVDTALTEDCAILQGERVTIPEALAGEPDFSKVYIMLGMNELGWSYSEVFKLKYGELIDTILEINPQADIYIQSILPVSAEKSANDPIYNNARIDEYNGLLQELAAEKQLYYVDVAAAVADADGCLPADAAWDGVHLKAERCAVWLTYLKCHTV